MLTLFQGRTRENKTTFDVGTSTILLAQAVYPTVTQLASPTFSQYQWAVILTRHSGKSSCVTYWWMVCLLVTHITTRQPSAARSRIGSCRRSSLLSVQYLGHSDVFVDGIYFSSSERHIFRTTYSLPHTIGFSGNHPARRRRLIQHVQPYKQAHIYMAEWPDIKISGHIQQSDIILTSSKFTVYI